MARNHSETDFIEITSKRLIFFSVHKLKGQSMPTIPQTQNQTGQLHPIYPATKAFLSISPGRTYLQLKSWCTSLVCLILKPEKNMLKLFWLLKSENLYLIRKWMKTIFVSARILSTGPLQSTVRMGVRFQVAVWVTTFYVVVQCYVLEFPFASLTVLVWCLVQQWQHWAWKEKCPIPFLTHSQQFQKCQPPDMFDRYSRRGLQQQPISRQRRQPPPMIPNIGPISIVLFKQRTTPAVIPPTRNMVATKAWQWHEDFLE